MADTRIEWTGNIQVHHPVRPVYALGIDGDTSRVFQRVVDTWVDITPGVGGTTPGVRPLGTIAGMPAGLACQSWKTMLGSFHNHFATT